VLNYNRSHRPWQKRPLSLNIKIKFCCCYRFNLKFFFCNSLVYILKCLCQLLLSEGDGVGKYKHRDSFPLWLSNFQIVPRSQISGGRPTILDETTVGKSKQVS